MIQTTQAIILSSLKTNGEKLVVRALTREFGKVSFLVYGAWSKRGGHKASLVFPLSLVSLSLDFKPNADLQIAKDISLDTSMIDLMRNPYKSTIALFIGEMLDSCIHQGEESEHLFEFCYNSALVLEHADRGVENFHIAMLVGLASHLGIVPNVDKGEKGYFDLMHSSYVGVRPPHPHYLDDKATAYLYVLTHITYRNMSYYKYSRGDKRVVLERIIEYYRLHVAGVGEIRSLQTLVEYYDF